jgi:hypothetical protein
MSRSLVCPAVVAGVLLTGAIPVAAQQAATPQPRQRNVITAEEIERLQGVEDAYQVVLRLRPEFFRVRARSQFRAPMPSPEDNPRDKPGASAQPSLSVTRARGAGQAPDPDAPEFTSGRTGGRTAAQRGGAVSGGEASSGALTGGSPQPRVGMMGPSYTEETGIAVYVGNMMYGGVEELTRLLAADVREIRYLSPSEAQFRFGPRYDAGVIMVTLK